MSQTITIKYRPHPTQLEFHRSKVRFRILSCGRRWGKTISGANEAIVQATTHSNTVGFCVAPTYWHTVKQWTEFLRFCPPEFLDQIHRADKHIILHNNCHIWFKSADNPDSLRSEGLDWLWLDEGAQIDNEAWELALRPALMDKHGIAWFTGTPRGHNWYFQLWTRGQDPQQSEYKSWQYPSSNNPYLDPKEIKAFAKDMPERAYQQEVLGMFIEDAGSVFRGIENCIQGTLTPPESNQSYVMGADLAKHEDFTVVSTLDSNGHLCSFDRTSHLDWVFQRRRILALCQQYNARLLIDSTGVGDPVLDELRRNNIRVEGYKFTSASKKDLIENLSMMIENKQITYPNIPELINELKIYSFKMTPSGNTEYSAPEGYHDDCVVSLALAAWLHRTSGPLQVSGVKAPW